MGMHRIMTVNAFRAVTLLHAPCWRPNSEHPSPHWHAPSSALVEECALAATPASRPDFDPNSVHHFAGRARQRADASLRRHGCQPDLTPVSGRTQASSARHQCGAGANPSAGSSHRARACAPREAHQGTGCAQPTARAAIAQRTRDGKEGARGARRLHRVACAACRGCRTAGKRARSANQIAAGSATCSRNAKDQGAASTAIAPVVGARQAAAPDTTVGPERHAIRVVQGPRACASVRAESGATGRGSQRAEGR